MDFRFRNEYEKEMCAEHIWLIFTNRETPSEAARETMIAYQTFERWLRVVIYRLGGEHNAKLVAERVMSGELDYPLDTLDLVGPKLIHDQITFIANNLPRLCDVTLEQAILNAAQALVERTQSIVDENTMYVTNRKGEKIPIPKGGLTTKDLRSVLKILEEAKRINRWKSYRVAELGDKEQKLAEREVQIAEREAELKEIELRLKEQQRTFLKVSRKNTQLLNKLSRQVGT